MTPYEALQHIKGILQPSTITNIASNGTIDTWIRIKELIDLVESGLPVNQEKDQEP